MCAKQPLSIYNINAYPLFHDMHTCRSHALCTFTPCTDVVGLFKPLSYQDRAVQLAYNNRSSQVCYEPFRPFSANPSEVWQDSE